MVKDIAGAGGVMNEKVIFADAPIRGGATLCAGNLAPNGCVIQAERRRSSIAQAHGGGRWCSRTHAD